MGTPRLPKGSRVVPPTELAERQQRQVERIYKHIERRGRTREWLDRVIEICRATRSDAGLPEGARQRATDRESALEKAAKHAEFVHAQLHLAWGPIGAKCAIEGRRFCVSPHPTLLMHFHAGKMIAADLTRTRARIVALKTRGAFFDKIPEVARTKGGAAAYLLDKYGFKHRHTALLCLVQNGFPVSETLLKAKTISVKKAVSSLPKDQRVKVRGLRWKDSNPHR